MPAKLKPVPGTGFMHDGEGNVVVEEAWTHRCPDCFATFNMPEARESRYDGVDDYGNALWTEDASGRIPKHVSRVSGMNPCPGTGKAGSSRYAYW